MKRTALLFYENLLRPNYEKYIKPNMNEIQSYHRILFDFQTLKEDADKLNENGDTMICNGPFYKFLIQKPELVISLLSCATANCYFKVMNKTNSESLFVSQSNSFQKTQKYPKHTRFKIVARIINFDKINSLKDLKSHSIEKYVFIRGTVIRIGTIKPLVLSMDYACRKCGGSSNFQFPNGKVMPITSCPSPNNMRCKAKNPQPLYETAKCIDHQKIRIQELSTDETGGRVPRTIDIELTEDLVDQCVPGDVVTIGGIVRAAKCESNSYNKRTLYQLYIQANSVIGIGNAHKNNGNKLGVVEFSEKDYGFINKLLEEPEPFRLLVNSLCPSIFGHEIVKAGLLLAMVGGNAKSIGNSGLATNKSEDSNTNSNEDDDGDGDGDGDAKMRDSNAPSHSNSGLHIRGDIHMLIVGDPGLGKSQMLRAVARIAPRGVYVSGNTTSVAGLTVTMVRDNGDMALEAGALVMGDQGICCIDEFDKMGTQHSALLEAMEQQSISIAKSGMVCTLSARTSVIAAANPCMGHYDMSKTISENIKMSAPLLSRFDLLFLLLDKPDQKHDQRLSEHVMKMLRRHQFNGNENKAKVPPSPRRVRDIDQIRGNTCSQSENAEREHRNKSLQQRLELNYSEYKSKSYEPIPESLLRKYIVYARKYCHPKMTSSAKRVLLNFYLELRKEHQQIDSTPITTRQLESLIRLAEARAKVELRVVVTESDAKDVVEVMRASIYDVMVNEVGKVDFKRSKGASLPKLQKEFKKILQVACREQATNRFGVAELRDIYSNHNFPTDKYEKLLELMNQNGTLLQKKGGSEYEFSPARDFSSQF